MNNIDLAEAIGIAGDIVSGFETGVGCCLMLQIDEIIEIPAGWVIPYNTRAFLEHGDIDEALAGNGPLFVSSKGIARVLPSAVPWSDVFSAAELGTYDKSLNQ